jgi:hypothetical protein
MLINQINIRIKREKKKVLVKKISITKKRIAVDEAMVIL